MDTVMLIIAICSLIATVATAFVIFILQVKLEKNSREKTQQMEETIRKRDLTNQARLFLIDNEDENEYLTLAQVATVKQDARGIYSDGSGRYKHKRKIYKTFHRCEIDLQKEIIRQAKSEDYKFEKYDIEELIDKMLKLFKEDAKEIGILEYDFLYDGGKYFHRGLDRYGNKNLVYEGKLKEDIWNHLVDFIDYKNAPDKKKFYDKLTNSAISRFVKPFYKERIYSRPKSFNEFEKMHKISPFDHYWYQLAQPATEDICTFVVMEMIRQGAWMIHREKYKKEWSISPEYAESKTYEDLYYATVLTLFCVFYDQVKDLEELKAKEEEVE